MSTTYYPGTTINGVRTAIEDLPNEMKAKVAEGVNIKATTVGELRALKNFPSGHEKLRIITPMRAVRRKCGATRIS